MLLDDLFTPVTSIPSDSYSFSQLAHCDKKMLSKREERRPMQVSNLMLISRFLEPKHWRMECWIVWNYKQCPSVPHEQGSHSKDKNKSSAKQREREEREREIVRKNNGRPRKLLLVWVGDERLSISSCRTILPPCTNLPRKNHDREKTKRNSLLRIPKSKVEEHPHQKKKSQRSHISHWSLTVNSSFELGNMGRLGNLAFPDSRRPLGRLKFWQGRWAWRWGRAEMWRCCILGRGNGGGRARKSLSSNRGCWAQMPQLQAPAIEKKIGQSFDWFFPLFILSSSSRSAGISAVSFGWYSVDFSISPRGSAWTLDWGTIQLELAACTGPGPIREPDRIGPNLPILAGFQRRSV